MQNDGIAGAGLPRSKYETGLYPSRAAGGFAGYWLPAVTGDAATLTMRASNSALRTD